MSKRTIQSLVGVLTDRHNRSNNPPAPGSTLPPVAAPAADASEPGGGGVDLAELVDDKRDPGLFTLAEIVGNVSVTTPDGKTAKAELHMHVDDGHKLTLVGNGSRVKIKLGSTVVTDAVGLGFTQYNGTWVLHRDGANLKAVAIFIL